VSQGSIWKEFSFRKLFKALVTQSFRKFSKTDEARQLWSNTLKGQLTWRVQLPLEEYPSLIPLYPELGKPDPSKSRDQLSRAIFITGRFRSGSTLLWNLFRNIDEVTAYYEPFNERRWFDVQSRGNLVDRTHRNVEEYWREYDGLSELGEYYSDEWIQKNLYMSEQFWDPQMRRYVELLIERAQGRPVLQFNRIDFRLPWFRANFPRTPIIHIYRHPRDQWCSSLVDPTAFSKTDVMSQFSAYDKFYLRMWASDLKYHFPFLDERLINHPYQLFYYIWKLSYIFGRSFAHYSIAFEELLADPERQLNALFQNLAIQQYNLQQLLTLIEKPHLGKWKTYADENWFQKQEAACEMILRRFFSTLFSKKRCL
jgi:hypothetical protein